MKESLLKLAKLLAEDEKFLQEFSSKKSVDEQYDFAQKSVKGYTKDEFVKFLDELEKSYKMKRDVLPEDLEKVSGGANAKTKAAAMAMLALTAAGGISNLASMPVGASAMMSTVADISLPNLLSEAHLSEFNYKNSSEKGEKREAIKTKLKSLTHAQKGEFEKSVRDHYEEERKDMGWIRSSGAWTGWKFTINLTHQKERLKNGSDVEKHKAEILLWLNEKFNHDYYLYYNKGWELATNFSHVNFDFDQFKIEKTDSTMDESEFVDIKNNITFKLNRARAFSGALREVGDEELASVIMPSE